VKLQYGVSRKLGISISGCDRNGGSCDCISNCGCDCISGCDGGGNDGGNGTRGGRF